MDIVTTDIEKLEKGNSYVVSIEPNNTELEIITVIEKFENSSIIRFENGEEKIYARWKEVTLYDHVPIKYVRKKKLDKIEKQSDK